MSTTELHRPNQRPFASSPALIAITLLVAAVIINPFREMCALDDSWAYARMVQHLLATGHYHLDAWSAANMPVQIYLAAALSKIFGYSLSLLRCSTLLLFVVALVGFHRLARELGHSATIASILTLAIAASPLVLMLAFTFMSDVQFLGWLMLALVLYFRGIRDRSAVRIFLGSLAAACAIGTRQFGAAIVVGLLLAWLWPSQDRPPVRLLFLGITAPFLATIAQIYAGLAAPNVTQTLMITEMREFFLLPIRTCVAELIWRCAAIFQYLGMSLLPLTVLVFKMPRTLWSKPVFRIPFWFLCVLACAAILLGLSIASPMSARPEARHQGLATPLELYWLLPTHFSVVPGVMWFLDIGGIAGGALLIALTFQKIQGATPRTRLHPEKIFLAGTAIGLFLMYLQFHQLNDTYLIALIPFALLLFGDSFKNVALSRSVINTCALVSVIFILATTILMRGDYARQQTIWNSADALAQTGVEPLNVGVPYWAEYHGLFDAWVAAGTPGYTLKDRHVYLHPPQDPYNIWRQSQWDHVPYRIMVSVDLVPPQGWKVIASRSYRSVNLSRRFVLTLMRDPSLQQQSGSMK